MYICVVVPFTVRVGSKLHELGLVAPVKYIKSVCTIVDVHAFIDADIVRAKNILPLIFVCAGQLGTLANKLAQDRLHDHGNAAA